MKRQTNFSRRPMNRTPMFESGKRKVGFRQTQSWFQANTKTQKRKVPIYAIPDFPSDVNIVAKKTVTNENPILERRNGAGSMTDGRRFCRKGLPGLQRGPYGIATTAPLHDESGPAATPGGPCGRTNPDILARKIGFSALRNCTDCEITE